MLKTIYTISREIEKKDIYIYGINRDSITVFTNLAFWRADICGFIDDTEQRYIGERFFNRPVISAEQIRCMRDIIVAASETVGKEVVKNIVGGGKVLRFFTVMRLLISMKS